MRNGHLMDKWDPTSGNFRCSYPWDFDPATPGADFTAATSITGDSPRTQPPAGKPYLDTLPDIDMVYDGECWVPVSAEQDDPGGNPAK